jgi:hypothetical protein
MFPKVSASVPKLLVLDSFTAHCTPGVAEKAKELGVHLLFIPGGYTSVCQPADVAWNKPLKLNISKEWSSFVIAQLDSVANGGKSNSS